MAPGTARLSVLIAVCFAALPARGQEDVPRFDLPLDCTVGESCFVQNYVDRDPGPGARDHTCGPLTTDGHKGTDIRLPDLAAMRAGVAVRAAAPGRVRAVRDGMTDVSVREGGFEAIAGRECGNGVAIGHGGGWESQYCHMRKGSIAVKPGDEVARGTPLGLVGLSGKTEFPHLHLEVRHAGDVVDPFVGPTGEAGCGGAGVPMWSARDAQVLVYRSSGLLASSFTARAPKLAEINEGRHYNARLPGDTPALVFWTHIFGLREGDVETLRLLGPKGKELAVHRSEPAERNRATQLRFIGHRLKASGWPRGVYRGEYRLTRGGQVVIEARREMVIR